MNHKSTPPKNPPPQAKLTDQQLINKNARTGLVVLGVFIVMIGLSFASVPLYRLFCAKTGFDGTALRSNAFPDKIVERTVRIQFYGSAGKGLNWDFGPEMREITVKLGEKGLAAFHARNREPHPVTGSAIYNVTPLKIGKYFHKVQCFCFGEQTLGPGQEVSMPVLFYVDPAMNDDPDMQDVKTITLSYTFYRAESNELERAMQAFYNGSDPAIQGANTN